MKAKVPTCKCHRMALRVSTAKTYDPKFCLYRQPIHFIGKQAIKFRGMTVRVPIDSQTSRDSVFTKLSTMMEEVDMTPITSLQKLLLYQAAICPTGTLWSPSSPYPL